MVTRRAFLRAIAGTIVAGATAGSLNYSWAAQPETTSSAAPGSDGGADIDSLLGELDDKVQAAMQEYGIPGVALGLLHQGYAYIRGYGVTNVDDPQPVDGDTIFRIASTTKTFTGTAVMRLVEQGKLDLDAPVRTYLPDFATSDPSVAPRVTLRQLLNHSPGWLGDYLEDTGPGDDALARYVAGIAQLPQLTPLGEVFADDWALWRFAGVSNLPAEPYALTQTELAPYEGRYTSQSIDESGAVTGTELEIKADNGQLHVTQREGVDSADPGDPTDIAETEDTPTVELRLAFYRDDYVLVYDAESGEPTFSRANFLRGADGGVPWLRFRGRLFRHQGVSGGLPETGGPDSVDDLLGQLLR